MVKSQIMTAPNLTEDEIKRRLENAYQPGMIASSDGYAGMSQTDRLTCAAVLVPLVRREGRWQVVYTRRTETVEHHKGQVSFPGGGCDAGEQTPEETALREAREEIGVAPKDVRLLGRLNEIVTITHYRITPVVGIIPFPYEFKLEPAEVSRAFTIPLAWLSRRENWDERMVNPDGSARSFALITYHPYDGEILWGASARMTHNFLSVLGLVNE